MSRSYYVNYELERKRREELRRKKLSETTERHYRSYLAQFESMIKSGYDAYIPDEMSRLKNDLSDIRDQLSSGNLDGARAVSQRVGSYIGSYELQASIAIDQYEMSQRMRVDRQRAAESAAGSQLMDLYYELVADIKDPITINAIRTNLEVIRKTIESNPSSLSEKMLKGKIADIVAGSKERVEQLRAKQKAGIEKAQLEYQLKETESFIAENAASSGAESKGFAQRMRAIRAMIDSDNYDADALSRELNVVEADVEELRISEEVRREAVRSIFMQLRKQEFSVSQPEMFKDGDRTYVRIAAHRPSGKRVVCDIDDTGSLKYKFDQYEGMTCLKDIEQFNVELERIYSIKLSDERVLWSNPDKLFRDSERSPQDDERSL